MADIYHRGRLIDHVHLRVSDLAAAKRFYRAVLATLGREPTYDSDEAIGFDELWIDAADSAGPSRVHLAFQAEDQDAVKRFYEAGLKAGGRDNGEPGERELSPRLLRRLPARSRRAQCRGRFPRADDAERGVGGAEAERLTRARLSDSPLLNVSPATPAERRLRAMYGCRAMVAPGIKVGRMQGLSILAVALSAYVLFLPVLSTFGIEAIVVERALGHRRLMR